MRAKTKPSSRQRLWIISGRQVAQPLEYYTVIGRNRTPRSLVRIRAGAKPAPASLESVTGGVRWAARLREEPRNTLFEANHGSNGKSRLLVGVMMRKSILISSRPRQSKATSAVVIGAELTCDQPCAQKTCCAKSASSCSGTVEAWYLALEWISCSCFTGHRNKS